MVKKAALKTAAISLAGFQPRPKPTDAHLAAPGTSSSGPREPGKMHTGVGSVMAAITREAEISVELNDAKAELAIVSSKLASFDGAQLVTPLDPRRIKRSDWANRLECEFGTTEFAELKSEIQSAGGNVQPIKVRPIPVESQAPGDDPPQYEIVYGHRRHQACLELGFPVNSIVVPGMDDRSLFEDMDRENRARKNLSAWEQGRMYSEAIRRGLYRDARRLAESLGVQPSSVTRATQLASLPPEVVAAFSSPLDLQFRWASPLALALQLDPDGVLSRARKARELGPDRSPAAVFEILINATKTAPAKQVLIQSGKKTLGQFSASADGKVSVSFEKGVILPDQHDALVEAIRSFLKSK
jgi:ParB family chromosome partitioning protein